MVVSEAATLARIEPFWSWNTPIAWTGFILFADAIVCRARGALAAFGAARVRVPGARVDPALAGIRVLQPVHRELVLRGPAGEFGRCGCSATRGRSRRSGRRSSLGAELVAVWRGDPSLPRPAGPAPGLAAPALAPPCRSPSPSARLMLLWPIVWPSPYLAAPVWLGFIFLLDPINARLGGESLTRRSGAQRSTIGSSIFPERAALRRALGVLELLGAGQVALHRARSWRTSRSSRCRCPAISGFRPSRSSASRCTSSCERCSPGGGLLRRPRHRSRFAADRFVIALPRDLMASCRQLEREIKLRFDDPAARARRRFSPPAPCHAVRAAFSRTALLDTPDGRLRDARSALRVRIEPDAAFLTFKGPVQPSTMKLREEIETTAGDPAALPAHSVAPRVPRLVPVREIPGRVRERRRHPGDRRNAGRHVRRDRRQRSRGSRLRGGARPRARPTTCSTRIAACSSLTARRRGVPAGDMLFDRV